MNSLNYDARQSIADISKKLKFSRDMVARIISKLEKDEVIQSYTYILNHEKIGYPRYRILLNLTNLTSNTFKDFFNFCQDHPNIIHLLKLFGNWQLLLDVEIESQEKLRELLRTMLNKYSEIIVRIENTRVYKIDKFRDIPLT